MTLPLAPKQLEFIRHPKTKWNIAWGSMRAGKTIATIFDFMCSLDSCPDSQIFMAGHTSETIYQNVVRLLLEDPRLGIFRPFCTWVTGKRQLKFRDKTITTLGARDEGSVGKFQGATFSRFYGDEMTLFPESIIDTIDTRLSNPHSMGWATLNPTHPNHKIKKWIDKAEEGNPNYYALHYTLDDNPYLEDSYKLRIKNSLSGVFYKRNYLGLWCLAEGAIFDFFNKPDHVVAKPPRAAEYWIAGIDYGTVNNFACLLIGISTGRYAQDGRCRWIEKEYVWDSRKQGRQKTNSEYADDVQAFLEPYGVNGIYVDPSAAAFKLELRKRGLHVIDADNDVVNGIIYMTSEMRAGNLFVCNECTNTIREIESYVWDSKAAEKGEDEPLKKDDHCIDAARYAVYTHKIPVYDQQAHNRLQQDFMQNKFNRRSNF